MRVLLITAYMRMHIYPRNLAPLRTQKFPLCCFPVRRLKGNSPPHSQLSMVAHSSRPFHTLPPLPSLSLSLSLYAVQALRLSKHSLQQFSIFVPCDVLEIRPTLPLGVFKAARMLQLELVPEEQPGTSLTLLAFPVTLPFHPCTPVVAVVVVHRSVGLLNDFSLPSVTQHARLVIYSIGGGKSVGMGFRFALIFLDITQLGHLALWLSNHHRRIGSTPAPSTLHPACFAASK